MFIYFAILEWGYRLGDNLLNNKSIPSVMRKISLLFIAMVLVLSTLALAATLKGSIYNSNLDLEKDVLVEINSVPEQKILSKDGNYEFKLPLGKYQLRALKGSTSIVENIELAKEGEYTLDLFMIPDLEDESDLWNEAEEELEIDVLEERSSFWKYGFLVLIGLIVAAGVYYFLVGGKKSEKNETLGQILGEIKTGPETVPENKTEPIVEEVPEPGYLDRALEIIKKHDGRIYQTELRKEMLDLSEAKVSLIVTELEHKGLVEKIKKGRGNVILLKKNE